MDDAPHYGYQPDRSYLPSPAEIAQQCEAIRSRWKEQPAPSWTAPVIHVTPEIAAELEAR